MDFGEIWIQTRQLRNVKLLELLSVLLGNCLSLQLQSILVSKTVPQNTVTEKRVLSVERRLHSIGPGPGPVRDRPRLASLSVASSFFESTRALFFKFKSNYKLTFHDPSSLCQPQRRKNRVSSRPSPCRTGSQSVSAPVRRLSLSTRLDSNRLAFFISESLFWIWQE